MNNKACEKAFVDWKSEVPDLDQDSFEIGFYEGSITSRRKTLLQLIIVPFFVGGISAAIINWMLS